MLSFFFALRIFYALVTVSALAVSILLVSYQRERQNLLLRSCCVAVLIMYAFILSGHIIHTGHPPEDSAFCGTQAFMLNFLYICIEAHAFFLMLNNCYIALSWKLHILEGFQFRERLFTLLAYGLPSLYFSTFWLMAVLTPTAGPTLRITPGPFFCAIVRPRFYLTTLWILVFAVPGSLLALYLLIRMWKSRQKLLRLKTSTQMTLSYLARYSISTFVYVAFSYGMIISLLAAGDEEEELGDALTASAILLSPWDDPEICTTPPQEDQTEVCCSEHLCPGILSFFPAIVGIAMFLMFGFGTHAQAAYRHFYDQFFHRTKRRNSTLPLMDTLDATAFPRRYFSSTGVIAEAWEDANETMQEMSMTNKTDEVDRQPPSPSTDLPTEPLEEIAVQTI